MSITLLRADMRSVRWPKDAHLVIADPPWTYANRFLDGKTPTDLYPVLSTKVIAAAIDAMPGRRLALWITNPLLDEWIRLTLHWSWGPIRTAGSWTKSAPGDTGHYGPGFHWSGCTEPVLIYTRPGSFNDRRKCRNAWIAPPKRHSAKPIGWQQQWIERWVPARGLILDPFAGRGSVALATIRAGSGRSYLGSEINPWQHRLTTIRIQHALASR